MFLAGFLVVTRLLKGEDSDTFHKWLFIYFSLLELSDPDFHKFFIYTWGIILTSIASTLDGLAWFTKNW